MNSEEERSKTPAAARPPAPEGLRAPGEAYATGASPGSRSAPAAAPWPGPSPAAGAPQGRAARIARVVCAVVPAAVAAAGAATSAAAHDDGVVRTAGAGFTGAFRALDLLVAAPAMLLPLGTRVARAGLASAFVTAVAGALAFDLALALASAVIPSALARVFPRARAALVRRGADAVSPRLVAAVAAVAVLTALLSPPWQAEASAPGGAVTGALLVLATVRLGLSAPTCAGAPLAFLLGLSLSYEPMVFAAALAAATPRIVRAALAARGSAAARASSSAARVACAFALGLVPLGLGFVLWRRPPEIALDVPLVTLFEPAARAVSPRAFASAELGVFVLAICASGALVSLAVAKARQRALELTLLVAVGGVALFLGAPAGPTRYAPALLAGLLAAHVLGATTLGLAVLAVARARVPFAEASAALLVVLELVLPVKAIDETAARREARAPHASAIWTDLAWGQAPPASVILVADRGTMRRVASARAAGAMRGDLIIVPAYDVQGRAGRRALAAEPRLAPLYRDVALGVPPEELSLATLSAQRAVLATFDPRWDRSLARHLVPVGLTSRFEAEPRGASDRKRALESFQATRDQLVRIAVAKRDDDLAAATATLLRARAVGMAATGERDLLSRALDDLRAFAPDDPVGATLVRRIVTTKGAIDVRDIVIANR